MSNIIIIVIIKFVIIMIISSCIQPNRQHSNQNNSQQIKWLFLQKLNNQVVYGRMYNNSIILQLLYISNILCSYGNSCYLNLYVCLCSGMHELCLCLCIHEPIYLFIMFKLYNLSFQQLNFIFLCKFITLVVLRDLIWTVLFLFECR